MKNLCIIAAVSIDGVIGIGDKIPWKIPADLQHYKRVTIGQMLIVGSKTYNVIPNDAKRDRFFSVLTNNPNYYIADNVKTFKNKDELLISLSKDEALKDKTIYIIGGSRVYNEFIDLCDSAIITWVNNMYPDGDKKFPINKLFSDFEIVGDHKWTKELNTHSYKITHYKRFN